MMRKNKMSLEEEIRITNQEEFERHYETILEDTRHHYNHMAKYFQEYQRYKEDPRFNIVYFENNGHLAYEVIKDETVVINNNEESGLQKAIAKELNIRKGK